MSERLEKINAMFYPKSVAVIGASARAGSVGNDVVKNLVSAYSGTIYPINPKGGKIEGRHTRTATREHSDVGVVCVSFANPSIRHTTHSPFLKTVAVSKYRSIRC